MSRTVAPPLPMPEPGESSVPGPADVASVECETGPAHDEARRAGRRGTAGARGAAAATVDEPEDWEPPTPDVGEEDQSLEVPDDDAQAQTPYC